MNRYEDQEFPDIINLSHKMYTARKEHKCFECDGKILPSEKYERLVSLVDGELKTYKRHDKACTDWKAEW